MLPLIASSIFADYGQHLGKGPYGRPLEFGFSLTGVILWLAGGFPGHCQFLPCLESVPVDCERGAGL
jgi:hypothetical protein